MRWRSLGRRRKLRFIGLGFKPWQAAKVLRKRQLKRDVILKRYCRRRRHGRCGKREICNNEQVQDVVAIQEDDLAALSLI
jgi:hypothetical protein